MWAFHCRLGCASHPAQDGHKSSCRFRRLDRAIAKSGDCRPLPPCSDDSLMRFFDARLHSATAMRGMRRRRPCASVARHLDRHVGCRDACEGCSHPLIIFNLPPRAVAAELEGLYMAHCALVGSLGSRDRVPLAPHSTSRSAGLRGSHPHCHASRRGPFFLGSCVLISCDGTVIRLPSCHCLVRLTSHV